MGIDGVDLEFEDDAVKEIAKLALERNTGARGLRSIIEGVMMDIMYDIPSRRDIAKCIITKNCIRKKEKPRLLTSDDKLLPAANE